MNLQLFTLGGCASPEQICKEQMFREAMPLFAIPAFGERETIYRQIINENILSISPQPRTPGLQEEQLILDLNNTSDQDKKREYRKIYSLCAGSLNFLTADKLRSLGLNTEELFGSIDENDMVALQLTPLLLNENSNVPELWVDYLPESWNLRMRIIYFNFDLTTLQEYLQTLIECYVSDPDIDLEKYYTDFVNGALTLYISGNDCIGEVAKHIIESPDETYRLSLLFLEEVRTEAGVALTQFSIPLEEFFKLRSRIPVQRADLMTEQTDTTTGSLGGHPITCLYSNFSFEASRLDFVDQIAFSSKSKGLLALDLDRHPHALAFRRPPLPEQTIVMESNDISWLGNELKIFNPDQVPFRLHVPFGEMQFLPADSTYSDPEVTVQISVTQETPSMQIDIQEEPSLNNIHTIDIEFLDCVLVPIKFWELKLKIGATELPTGINVVSNDVLQEANRLLGIQSNLYLYMIDSVVLPITLNEQTFLEGQNTVNFILDYAYTGHNQAIQDAIKNSPAELNVIWSWDLVTIDKKPEEKDPLGATLDFEIVSTDFPNFRYPYILIKGTPQFLDHNRDPEKERPPCTDADRGRFLAHEFGHWIRWRFKSIVTDSEQMHYDHLPEGHDAYSFNLMQANDAANHESLTIEQARILNQYATKIVGAIPHTQ